ncbi:MAG TPA: protein kinase [Thermoanaerobaculia bacterium]|nr:protein kinase [Thermoanaerobaculia bacterium]
MSFRSRFTHSPQKAAEEYVGRGDFKRAIEAFERAGDWRRAAQIAAEVKDEEALVRSSLMAAMGRIPEGLCGGEALTSAAELLLSQKHYDLAIPLFEMAWDFCRAAECALASKDPVRAAKLYERAGDRLEAARCFQNAGKPKDALQLLEEGSKTTPAGALPAGRVEEILLLRADLLRQLGRESAAMELLSSIPPSPRIAELLERSGRLEDAVNCFLDLGETEKARRVAAKSSSRDRLLARIYLRSGRPVEAANLFAELGLAREAAEAYETARDWGRAAYRWEAAHDLERAAEAYEKAGRLHDASRCFAAAGLNERVARIAARAAEGIRKPSPGARTHSLKTASTHLQSGDKARAASLLMQIRPHEPEFAQAVILLVPLLLEERFFDDALSRLRQIPVDAGAAPVLVADRFYWEGRTLEAMGDKDGAQACYERALVVEPTHQPALEGLNRLRQPAAPERFPTDQALAEGYRLAERYDILSPLGRGGMGRVYKAHDRELGETVAIKTLLRPEDGGRGEEVRLLREVQICRKISHPNVVRVYDLGRFRGGIFVTMEYLEGITLQQVIDNEAPPSFARLRDILIDIASGLREAHSLGVVHRDLKPANVMVTANRAKILDFGIACIRGGDGRLTQAGFVMGSPMYMSPDQLLFKELDGRSDLYSFGVLAYTLLAGREPFDNAEPAVLALKQLREPPPDVRSLRQETPSAWVAFLDRLMEKEPADRYPSAQAVLDVLETLPCPDDSDQGWQTCRV